MSLSVAAPTGQARHLEPPGPVGPAAPVWWRPLSPGLGKRQLRPAQVRIRPGTRHATRPLALEPGAVVWSMASPQSTFHRPGPRWTRSHSLSVTRKKGKVIYIVYIIMSFTRITRVPIPIAQ